MARSASAGELKTRIKVFDVLDGEALNENGYPVQEPINVFGEGGSRMCKWVNAYGVEIYTAKQAGVTEPATLTMRYTPLVTPTSTIYKGSDPRPYEVISVNDVEDRHAWLEVKVQRKVESKQ
ncbi:MAG TPA: head-tail adaptor protein [Pseudoflavonifractor sp.]|nr:head-tail adaptor protein [Pseudoflavonifractor sp.]